MHTIWLNRFAIQFCFAIGCYCIQGYYLLLFDAMRAVERCDSRFADCFLHVFTLRNLLFNCIGMILRVVYHPAGIPFCPSRTMENVAEQHFAAKKVGVGNASPSLAACLWSTQKTHLRQLLRPTVPPTCPTSTDLAMEDAQKIMLKAFHMASRFESITSVGESAAALRQQLVKCLVGLWEMVACWGVYSKCYHLQICFIYIWHYLARTSSIISYDIVVTVHTCTYGQVHECAWWHIVTFCITQGCFGVTPLVHTLFRTVLWGGGMSVGKHWSWKARSSVRYQIIRNDTGIWHELIWYVYSLDEPGILHTGWLSYRDLQSIYKYIIYTVH